MCLLSSLVSFLLAVNAAAVCPREETWYELNGKCYSKRNRGTHAECAAMCGANASHVHITSQLENEFVTWVARGDIGWIGLYKMMDAASTSDPGFWGRWTSSDDVEESAFTNWQEGKPDDACGASNCGVMLTSGQWSDFPCTWSAAGGELSRTMPTPPFCLCEYPAVTNKRYFDDMPLIEEICEGQAGRFIFQALLGCAVVCAEVVREWRMRAQQRVRLAAHQRPTPTASEDGVMKDGKESQTRPTEDMVVEVEVVNAADAADAADDTTDADDVSIGIETVPNIVADGEAPEADAGASSLMLSKPFARETRGFLGRRQSRIVEHQHLNRLLFSSLNSESVERMGIKHLEIALFLAGIRAPLCVSRGRRLLDKAFPAISRAITTWYFLAGAEANWNDGDLLSRVTSCWFLVIAIAAWILHVAMVIEFVENPTHLLFVTEPLVQDMVAWEALRSKLVRKALLVVSLLVSCGLGYVNRFNFLVGFIGSSVALSSFGVMPVICLRLLSAGHVRLLIDLEQRISLLLRDTAERDKSTFYLSVDNAERSVAGAMGVSNGKMLRVIWLMLVLFAYSIYTSLVCIKILLSYEITTNYRITLFMYAAILCVSTRSLFSLLNLLRSVGDALDDLVGELLEVQNLAHASKFFEEPSCLASRFSGRHTARKLTWVLLTEPVTSTTTQKALGGVLISIAIVFLPDLLNSIS